MRGEEGSDELVVGEGVGGGDDGGMVGGMVGEVVAELYWVWGEWWEGRLLLLLVVLDW